MFKVLDIMRDLSFLTRVKDKEAQIKKSLWLNASNIISHLNFIWSIRAGGMNFLRSHGKEGCKTGVSKIISRRVR
jgi:hypothetical protein